MTNKSYKFYVGIDVAKNKLDVALSKNDELFQVVNNESDFKDLVKKLPPQEIDLDCYGSKRRL